jgi:DNA helicase-2/ATP-dependent DNA helicase PcrA
MAWWTLLHLTSRLGPAVIDKLCKEAKENGSRFGETLLRLHGETALARVVGTSAENRVAEILKVLEAVEVPHDGPWGEWITESVHQGLLPQMPAEALSLLPKMDELTEQQIPLERFVGLIQPLAQDIARAEEGDAVRLMTMAASKGLTAQASIVMGCEGNIIPLPKAKDVHEERRLLYVAMTRPREYLFLTRARRRTGATARIGNQSVQTRRTICPFLEGGPVNPRDGQDFLRSF